MFGCNVHVVLNRPPLPVRPPLRPLPSQSEQPELRIIVNERVVRAACQLQIVKAAQRWNFGYDWIPLTLRPNH